MTIRDSSFFKIFRAIGALLIGKTYVSSFKTINGSIWWDDEKNHGVASFDRLYKTTAIGVVNENAAYIYFPTHVQVKIHYHDCSNCLATGVFDFSDHPVMCEMCKGTGKKETSRQYLAKLKLHKIMLRSQLENWIDQLAKHPFV